MKKHQAAGTGKDPRVTFRPDDSDQEALRRLIREHIREQGTPWAGKTACFRYALRSAVTLLNEGREPEKARRA